VKILVENRGGEGISINLLFYLWKIEGGEGGRPELFLRRENKKNQWYFSTIPKENPQKV
jgi:hypothetical protein